MEKITQKALLNAAFYLFQSRDGARFEIRRKGGQVWLVQYTGHIAGQPAYIEITPRYAEELPEHPYEGISA